MKRFQTKLELNDLPKNITWQESIPPSFNIQLLEEKNKTTICLVDSFGGEVAWAKYDGIIECEKKEEPLDAEEMRYIEKYYPRLYKSMYNE